VVYSKILAAFFKELLLYKDAKSKKRFTGQALKDSKNGKLANNYPEP
jgi:hypothetical protein